MNILVIEDNAGDAELVLHAIEQMGPGCEVKWVTRLSDGLEAAESTAFDLVFTDLSLPDSSGIETLTRLRERALQTPLIVLTSLADDRMAMAALDEGAQDYLIKDELRAETLRRAIRYAVHRHELAAENMRLVHQLQDAKSLLERKNRRLETLYKTAQNFVDHVSHEFRTPLSVIKEYASLVRDGLVGEVNAEQRRMLDVIDDRSDDLNTMVDDMLDVHKLEAGLLGAWRRECRVEEIVEHVLPALQRKAATRRVAFSVDIDLDLPRVYCDPEKAGRVVVNLVVNAVKFATQPGRVRLWARADGERREVVIGVSDNGPGIGEADLKKIFKRFAQLDTQLRSSTKGFGLGLSIAKELVDLNLGTMSVDSQPEMGSTFSFTVPLAVPREVVSRYVVRLSSRRRVPAIVTLMLATIDEDAGRGVADDVDRFLNHLLRRNDLLFRIGCTRWLVVVPTPEIELDRVVARAGKARDDVNRNRPYDPLPEVGYQAVGRWRADESPSAFLSLVDRLCACKEPVYA